MKKILVRNMMVLGLYITMSQGGFASSLPSPIDDEAFSEKQRKAMAKLTAPAALPVTSTSGSKVEVGELDVKAGGDSKAAFVVGKIPEDVKIKLGDVEVSAEGQSKAVAILNKSGGTSSDIEAGKVSVNARGNSQAYGFIDDESDW